MSTFTIPKSFQLLGQTITVNWDQRNFVDTDAVGFASYRLNEIQLRKSTESNPRPPSRLEETFWHELTHHLIYRAEDALPDGGNDLHSNEQFVRLLSGLLQQALGSFKYDEEEVSEDAEKV